jgi:hypothetical protein
MNVLETKSSVREWIYFERESSIQFLCSGEKVRRKCLSLKVVIVNNNNFRCVTLHHCTKETSVHVTSYGRAYTDGCFEECNVR